jgi:hypothetical protein
MSIKPLYTTEALATGAGRNGHVSVTESPLAFDGWRCDLGPRRVVTCVSRGTGVVSQGSLGAPVHTRPRS